MLPIAAMGASIGQRQPRSRLLAQAVALAAAATLLLALLRQCGDGPLSSPDGALFLKAASKHQSGSAALARGQSPRRHVTAASCPTTEQVAASPWARSCHHVTRACVDLGLFKTQATPG